jgi:hypothetical protein
MALLALAAAAGPLAAPVSAAVPPAKIIGALNAQRAEHGLPAGIVEREKWSRACAKHVRWMRLNGQISHSEDPGTPGYSKSGDWAAARSVVAAGAPLRPFTTPAANPYVNAPYHLAQLLHPRLSVMGAAEDDLYDCQTTWPGYKRKAPTRERIYSYPGAGTRIQWAQRAIEDPSVPGDEVGLPQGTTTGPNIIVYWDGPADKTPLHELKRGWLTGPGKKKVAVRVVPGGYLGSGGNGFVIPVKALKPDTRYTAKVSFGSPETKHRYRRSWKFRTTPLTTGRDAVELKLMPYGPDDVWVGAVRVDPVYAGRTATLSGEYRRGEQLTRYITATKIWIDHGGYPLPQPDPGETLTLKLVVHGFKAGPTRVPAFTLTEVVAPD